jgi:glycosyltransferase involved in cell wall biosynthesis
VVVNGSTDDTLTIAKGFTPAVHVVELPEASKPKALNYGDSVASHYPRFYVDADILVDATSLRRVADALRAGPALVAAPALRLETKGASWLVRSHYRVWSALPSVADDIVGRGVYGLSAKGRSRFGQFPEIIGDDQFIRRSFAAEERMVLADASSVVSTPRTYSALLRRRGRVLIGNADVDRILGPERISFTRHVKILAALAKHRPDVLPHIPIYGLTCGMAWVLCRLPSRRARAAWARDDSRDGLSPILREARTQADPSSLDQHK